MVVFRIERTRDYTVMSNHHLRNANPSTDLAKRKKLAQSLQSHHIIGDPRA